MLAAPAALLNENQANANMSEANKRVNTHSHRSLLLAIVGRTAPAAATLAGDLLREAGCSWWWHHGQHLLNVEAAKGFPLSFQLFCGESLADRPPAKLAMLIAMLDVVGERPAEVGDTAREGVE